MVRFAGKWEVQYNMETNNMVAGRFEALKKVQAYNFAAHDMLLFLDTHPDDKSAFAIFKDLVVKAKNSMAEFEKTYGPLTAFSSAAFDTFNWLESPWPWEKEANV